jgi:glycerol-3-phosphate cytidylyltransferase
MSKVVISYGTFDLFHVGHLNLLTRLRALGDKLVVGVSTDEFNALKGKRTFVPFEDRAAIVRALGCVDEVFPEDSWDQKRSDIVNFRATTLGMGSDWSGRFDEYSDLCEVVYLPRTEAISSTELKKLLNVLDQQHVRELKDALDMIASVVRQFE